MHERAKATEELSPGRAWKKRGNHPLGAVEELKNRSSNIKSYSKNRLAKKIFVIDSPKIRDPCYSSKYPLLPPYNHDQLSQNRH
jgi:hypothetical protein